MVRKYTPYIPQDPSQLVDHLAVMMHDSPKFIDKSGYFPGKNIDTAFHALSESLSLNRFVLGEELYTRLGDMSGRMRAHFEADPEDKTGESRKGRALIQDMSDLLIQRLRQPRQGPPSQSG